MTKKVATKKKSNTLYYVLGGVGLLTAVILFSSFTASTAIPCAQNPECLIAYWSNKIKSDAAWYARVKGSFTTDSEINASLRANAEWMASPNNAQPLPNDFNSWAKMYNA